MNPFSIMLIICMIFYAPLFSSQSEGQAGTQFSSQGSLPADLDEAIEHDRGEQITARIQATPKLREAPFFKRAGFTITPLGLAARHGREHASAALLAQRARQSPDEEGVYPITHAVRGRHRTICEQHLAHAVPHAAMQQAIQACTEQIEAGESPEAATQLRDAIRLNRDRRLMGSVITSDTGLPSVLGTLIVDTLAGQAAPQRKKRKEAPKKEVCSQPLDEETRFHPLTRSVSVGIAKKVKK